jgi:hypothetical protein
MLRTLVEPLTLIDEGVKKGVDWVGTGLALRHRYQECGIGRRLCHALVFWCQVSRSDGLMNGFDGD